MNSMENTLHEDVTVSAESSSTKKRKRTLFKDTIYIVLAISLLVCLLISFFRDTPFTFIFATNILGVITESYLLWLYTKVHGKPLKEQWPDILCLALFAFGVISGILTLSGLV